MSRIFLPKLSCRQLLSAGSALSKLEAAVWVALLATRRMASGLLEAVRGLRLADPELGPKPLLAKLREQQPDLGAGNKEVREALLALKAESEATEAAAAAPPAAAAPFAADEDGAPSSVPVALSLACFGCGRLPSEMGDGRVKHDVCPICVKLKVLTTYWCCLLRQLPGEP